MTLAGTGVTTGAGLVTVVFGGMLGEVTTAAGLITIAFGVMLGVMTVG